MNYLLPLIGIGDRVVFKYDEKIRQTTPGLRKADVKSSQIYFNCLDINEQASSSQEEKKQQMEIQKLKDRRGMMKVVGGRKTRRKKLKTVFPYLSRKNRSLMYG